MTGAHASLDAWIDHLAHERRASPRTLESYRAGVGAWLAFLGRHRGEAITETGLGAASAADRITPFMTRLTAVSLG